MTATESAAMIRKALKRDHGWTGRQVSVRSEYYSMGSSIHVRIKDPSVNPALVRKVAGCHQRVRRCEISGEILSGGNMFVNVSWDHDVLRTMSAQYLDAVETAERAITHASIVPVDGTPFGVGLDNGLHLWGESHHIAHTFTAQSTAEVIASQLASRHDVPCDVCGADVPTIDHDPQTTCQRCTGWCLRLLAEPLAYLRIPRAADQIGTQGVRS